MGFGFFAFLSRMKYIERWGLMRNIRRENISDHSLETAILAHALVNISNVYLNKNLNPERAAVLAIFHDATETITGDMPTPVKYYNSEIQTAYKKIDEAAKDKLINMLPDEMKPCYDDILNPTQDDLYIHKLVKASDTLSAYIKCIEERLAGNTEFLKAEKSIKSKLLAYNLKEVEIFFEKFISSYEKTIDEL